MDNRKHYERRAKFFSYSRKRQDSIAVATAIWRCMPSQETKKRTKRLKNDDHQKDFL